MVVNLTVPRLRTPKKITRNGSQKVIPVNHHSPQDICPPGETADRSASANTTHPMEDATRVFVKAFKRFGSAWTPRELRTPGALARSQNYLLSLIDLPAGEPYNLGKIHYVRSNLSSSYLFGLYKSHHS